MRIPREIINYLRIVWLISKPLKVVLCTSVFLQLLCMFMDFNWKKYRFLPPGVFTCCCCGIWVDCNLWTNSLNNNIAINSVVLWKGTTQLECSRCIPACRSHRVVNLHIKIMLTYCLQRRNWLCKGWYYYFIIVVSLVYQAKTWQDPTAGSL